MTSRDTTTGSAEADEDARTTGSAPLDETAAGETGRAARRAGGPRRARRRHAADDPAEAQAVSGAAAGPVDDPADDAGDASTADSRGRGGRGGRGARSGRGRRGAAADTAVAGRRRSRWLLPAAVVVAALFAGAMVALFVVTRPDPIAGLSRSQDAALSAARQAAINLQTYRRASFDQDFANALASTTPEFRSQQLEPRRDALQQQLTTGGRDAEATVLSAGLVSSTDTQAQALVLTSTVQTADDGTSTPFLLSRLQITVQLVDGTWLLSDLTTVGLS